MINSEKIIQQYYDALAARDREKLLSLLDPEIEVIYYGQPDQLPWAGTFSGIEGFDSFFKVIAQYLEIVEVQRLNTIASESQVVVQCKGIWQFKENGAQVHGAMVNVFTLNDQKLRLYEVYADTEAFHSAMP